MVHVDKNTGSLIIEIPKNEHYFNPVEELECRRDALFNAIVGMSKDYLTGDSLYYLVRLLQDLEPTFEQYKAMLV